MPRPRGRHSDVADPRRVPKVLAEWIGLAVAVGAALWFFFVALDPGIEALQNRWADHPRFLIVCGWLPVGGLLCAGAAVAIRLQWLRDRGRKMSWLEENVYGFVGLAWIGFAMLMIGKQGRFEPYDAGKVIDHVALTSEAIAWGVVGGVAAAVFVPVMALGYGVVRLTGLPRPGWPFPWTAASWLLGAAFLSLALVIGVDVAYR